MEKEQINLLLVEDDDADASLTEDLLPDCGRRCFEIVRARRLEDALAALGERRADVGVLDLNLPDSTGGDTFRVVRRRASGVPRIILSGADDPAPAHRVPDRTHLHPLTADRDLSRNATGQLGLPHGSLFGCRRQCPVKRCALAGRTFCCQTSRQGRRMGR